MLRPDSPTSYGTLTRFFHWLMTIGLFWMFLTATLHHFFDESEVSETLWPTHKPMGFTLFMLIILRLIWLGLSASRRPPLVSWQARAGHGLLYVLMLAIPSIALIRQYGSGRAFSYFGLPITSETGIKTQWMIDMGGLLHGELGWTLLALTAGHILMVVWHRYYGATNVLPRMWGRRNSR